MGAIPKQGALRASLTAWRDLVAEHHSRGSRSLHYQGDTDLVLREGRAFESVPWKTWRGRGYRRGRERQCFMNAHRLALAHPELTYVEGFATRGLLPVHHAWCATADGRVVDPTWREYPELAGTSADPVEQWEYLGIPFEFDFVDDITFEKGTYGVLDESRLYEEPLPDGAIRRLEKEEAHERAT